LSLLSRVRISYIFFSRFVTFLSRFYVRSLEYSYVFSDPNIHFRSEVRSYLKNVPTVFFKNRSFGGVEPPEGLEIVPDILTQNFLEIRILTATGAGSDQPCSAGLGRAKMDEFFTRIIKGGERTCRGSAGEMS
jgi:hypothetical protein